MTAAEAAAPLPPSDSLNSLSLNSLSLDSLPLFRWIVAEAPATEADRLARAAGLPPLVAQLLYARGVRSAEQARQFLHPQIGDLLDPYTMRGMTEAVARVQAAIRCGEPILIYGDYDADGTTAIVLLKTAIEMLGGTVRFHVPHRIRDGYGMQAEVLATAAAEGIRLVISVDSGIRAFAAAEAAAGLGLDLIITDHHLPESPQTHSETAAGRLPEALAILNPNQPDCGYACKHLCGAGVAFKLAQALLEAHDLGRARGKILPSFLKLLAIATVADAVPLLGENRTILGIGIEELRRPVHPGLRRLFELARLGAPGRRLTSTDLAFRIAPRINAAGRMDVASDVVDLFTTRDPARAAELAEKLDRLNGERRLAEAAVLEQIERRLQEEAAFAEDRCLVIDGEGWHRGILGILASRVVDRWQRPTLVIARENGEAHGSGRSIPGFHLLDAIESCRDLFTRFGGHAHAVGFSLPSERVLELRRRLQEWAALTLRPDLPGLHCDAVLPLDRITPALSRHLRQLEPFGMGNEDPVFVAHDLRVAAPPRIFKERHVQLRLAQANGSPGKGATPAFAALGWNWASRVRAANLDTGAAVHLAYKLRENEHPEFGGLELEIVDLAPAASSPASGVSGI
ncbi:MAG TPA: single-stranded-DNA-specific exonuclease RecJ [Acidobacteriaceae bacterium]|nr:single-stranded-DNA-specific exonuclease RecJ [Acidobacteriaceae bacterium]